MRNLYKKYKNIPPNFTELVKKEFTDNDYIQFALFMLEYFQKYGADTLEMLRYDQEKVLIENTYFILKNTGLDQISIYNITEDDMEQKRRIVLPGRPDIRFSQ